jgi:hypothetical protein
MIVAAGGPLRTEKCKNKDSGRKTAQVAESESPEAGADLSVDPSLSDTQADTEKGAWKGAIQVWNIRECRAKILNAITSYVIVSGGF